MHGSLTREILTPHSIQRCIISNGRIGYEHMEPSYSFGAGHQHEAFRQLKARGIDTYEVSIDIGSRSLSVHLVAEPDFDIDGYRDYLERMAHGTLTLDAPTGFERAIVGQHVSTHVWFDFTTKVAGKGETFHNAVFWTLSKKTLDELVSAIKMAAS